MIFVPLKRVYVYPTRRARLEELKIFWSSSKAEPNAPLPLDTLAFLEEVTSLTIQTKSPDIPQPNILDLGARQVQVTKLRVPGAAVVPILTTLQTVLDPRSLSHAELGMLRFRQQDLAVLTTFLSHYAQGIEALMLGVRIKRVDCGGDQSTHFQFL